jgi:transcriptional regulator with PAS, ATPase and Fis domain
MAIRASMLGVGTAGMSDSRLFSTDTCLTDVAPATGNGAARLVHVSADTLARLPVQRLARLLLENAARDPALLSRLHASLDDAPAHGNAPSRFDIIGDSPAMRQIAGLVRRFGQTDDPVLITGESGTGKELLAHAIHQQSRRRGGPFVVLNCAALPPGLVASELFGFEKGAFTGAVARGIGQIEHANGGTLFLDEIGDMPVDLQGHLLRFLQDGQIRRVGGRDTFGLNVRIVSATNVRLRQAIADGRFREDLFYRLNVLTIPVPPLRERPEDILALARHFQGVAARDFGRPCDGFTLSAERLLLRYKWPGNVRELISVVRRAVVVSDEARLDVPDLIGLEDCSASVEAMPAPTPKPGSDEERDALVSTLERTGENITSTAQALRVSRVTLYRMLRRHRIVLKRGLAEGPAVRHAQR